MTAGGYESLDSAVTEGILTLTLDRHDELNAFTVTIAHELIAASDRADKDDTVAVGDGKERVAAFLAKREPDFRSRTTDLPPFYPWQY